MLAYNAGPTHRLLHSSERRHKNRHLRKTKELTTIVTTGQDLRIVRVPGHYWHGFKTVSSEPAMLLYFTTRLHDDANPDEERRPWDDHQLTPVSIDDKKDDPRAGKPWDWNYPPHK